MAKSTTMRTISEMLLLAASSLLATLDQAESKPGAIAAEVTSSTTKIRLGAAGKLPTSSLTRFAVPRPPWPQAVAIHGVRHALTSAIIADGEE